MLIVHVALETRVGRIDVPLTEDRSTSEVAGDGRGACDDVVLTWSGTVAFGRTEETCGPVEAASIGHSISCSLEIPVAKLPTLRDRVSEGTTVSVAAGTGKAVARVTLEYGA
jgi:hypothetical protein